MYITKLQILNANVESLIGCYLGLPTCPLKYRFDVLLQHYFFNIAVDLAFNSIFGVLLFLLICPGHCMMFVESCIFLFMFFIVLPALLPLLTAWSEVDYLLVFLFLLLIAYGNSSNLQRNLKRFLPARNANPLLKSLKRFSLSLSLVLYLGNYHGSSLRFVNQTLCVILGARMVVHWWWGCFCCWISRTPRFFKSYWWPHIFQVCP